ncbi:MAG: hypothetical protein ACK4K7_12100 [Allosphingosinicella sp.]
MTDIRTQAPQTTPDLDQSKPEPRPAAAVRSPWAWETASRVRPPWRR